MPYIGSKLSGLRVFISYPGKDGLGVAKQAADILNQSRHKPWVYDQHRTLGVLIFEEIAVKIQKAERCFAIYLYSLQLSIGLTD